MRLFPAFLPVFAVVAAVPALAQEAPPATLDLASLPADLVDEVVVPVPGEVFTALDRCGAQNWSEALIGKDRLSAVAARPSRNETGLLLGLVVANGFLAVQAEDRDAVKTTGEKVLLLADALGVKDAVLQHSEVIVKGAEDGNWLEVRRELDRVELSVRNALDELADEEVAQLISLGGWLGGTDALLDLQQENYSADAAGLLHQPDLAAALHEQVEEFEAQRKEDPAVSRVETALESIQPLMEPQVPDQAGINSLRAVTEPVVQSLLPPDQA